MSGVVIEDLDRSAALRFAVAWEGLAERAIEPNPFFAPSFLAPALQHLGAAENVRLLLASRAPSPQILGVWPVVAPKGPGFVQTWLHPFSPHGVPLLAAEHREEVLKGLIEAALAVGDHVCGVRLACAPSRGAFADLLRSCAGAAGYGLVEENRRERPIFRGRASTTGEESAAQIDSLARKTRRQSRRLEKLGRVEHVAVRLPPAASEWFERFLALEASGWKGRRGTALLMDPQTSVFSRVMIRRMAEREAVEIDALTLDGEPVAMTVSLICGRASFIWKTCYDERHSECSPGAQMIVRLSERLGRDPRLERMDSCATPDNPMIYRMWPEVMSVSDFYVYDAGRESDFARAHAREKRRAQVLDAAKRTYRAARSLGA